MLSFSFFAHHAQKIDTVFYKKPLSFFVRMYYNIISLIWESIPAPICGTAQVSLYIYNTVDRWF